MVNELISEMNYILDQILRLKFIKSFNHESYVPIRYMNIFCN